MTIGQLNQHVVRILGDFLDDLHLDSTEPVPDMAREIDDHWLLLCDLDSFLVIDLETYCCLDHFHRCLEEL